MANPNPPLENLRPRPWQPGQSGNPKGRPPGRTVGAILRDRLASIDEGEKEVTAERVAAVILREALAGDIRFMELLLNRAEGKVPNAVEDTTDEDASKGDTGGADAFKAKLVGGNAGSGP